MAYGADGVETTLRYLEQAAQYYNEAITTNPKEDYFFKPHETNLVVQGARVVGNLLRKDDEPVKKVTRPPLERVQAALARYQTIYTQQEAWDGVVKADAAGEAGAKNLKLGQFGAPTVPKGTMTNQDVIEMARAGVDEELILGAIDDAKACDFDLGSKALIDLTKAKVTKPVIKALQGKICTPGGAKP